MADIRTTGLLSAFDDPAEDPLSEGGRWNQVDFQWQPLAKAGGNAIRPSADSDIAFSYWTLGAFNGDVEVWGYPTGGQLGASVESWRLSLWSQSTIGGYNAVSGWSGLFGGGIFKGYFLRKYVNGAFTDVDASPPEAYPNAMLLRRRGNDVELWGSLDMGANWTLQCAVTDTDYMTDMQLALGLEDPTNGGVTWDGFGGGVLNRTQIYRYVSN